MKILARSQFLEEPNNGSKVDAPTPLNVRIEAVRVYNFEVDLANVIRSFSPSLTMDVDEEEVDTNLLDTRSDNKTAERIPLTQLDSEYPFINWTRTFSLLPGPPKVTHVYVQDMSYLQALKELFSRHSRETIDNYLCWTFIARSLPYSSKEMKNVYEDFKRQIPDSGSGSGSSATDASKVFISRWKECVHVTSEGLKLPVSVLYLQEKGDQLMNVKSRATDIIVKIKEAFSRVMEKQSWIKSQEIKKLLQERIQSIESRVALPDYLFNSSHVDDLYSGLKIDEQDVFLKSVIDVTRYDVLLDLRKLNQRPEPEKDWLLQPLISNAYFDSMHDNISEYTFVVRFLCQVCTPSTANNVL